MAHAWRRTLVRLENQFVQFFAGMAASGLLIAGLSPLRAVMWALAGGVGATVLMGSIRAIVTRFVGEEVPRERTVRPAPRLPSTAEEWRGRSMMSRVRFYAWALPLVGLAVVLAWAVTVLATVVIVASYAVVADRATALGTASALVVSIAAVALNEYALVLPLCRRWGIAPD